MNMIAALNKTDEVKKSLQKKNKKNRAITK